MHGPLRCSCEDGDRTRVRGRRSSHGLCVRARRVWLGALAFLPLAALLACQPRASSNLPSERDAKAAPLRSEDDDPRALCETLCARHRACDGDAATRGDVLTPTSTPPTKLTSNPPANPDRGRGTAGSEHPPSAPPQPADEPLGISNDEPLADLEAWCRACDGVAEDPARAAAWREAGACRGLAACEALVACVGEALAVATTRSSETREPVEGGEASDLLGEAEGDLPPGGEAQAARTGPRRQGAPPARRASRRAGTSSSALSTSAPAVQGAGDDDACVPYCDRALVCGVGEPDASSERVAALRAAAEAPWFECLRTCRLERRAGRGARLDACLDAPTCDGFAPCLSDE